jgi:hypothetical protein
MAAIAEKIWAATNFTWVEADPDEQQRLSEIEYVRADIYRVALMKIQEGAKGQSVYEDAGGCMLRSYRALR